MNVFGKDCYFVDMTQLIDEDVATWEGECGFQPFIDIDYNDHKDKVRLMRYEMFAGVGTHIDSPAHFHRDHKTVSDILPENLISKANVLDVSFKVIGNPDYMVLPDDIFEWENENGIIESGSIFLINTGWSKYWTDKIKYRNEDEIGKLHFPGLSLDAAEILIERDVLAIGIDTLSVDGGYSEPDVHKKFLGIGSKYFLENVSNIDRLPAKGSIVVVAPLKVKGGSEAPVRMFGFVEK